MVAVLVRLRFRVLGNTLKRNTFQLVAVIAGAVAAVGLLGMAAGLMIYVSTAPVAATQAAVVVGGSALVLGWLVVPLLFDGVDRTLDPVALGRFPLTPRQLMTATFFVGLLWVPGIASLTAALLTGVAWSEHAASAVLAVVAALVGTVTCVIGSRLSTSLAALVLRRRKALRGAVAVIVVLAIALLLAAAPGHHAPSARSLLSGFGAVIDVLGWTPLGAIWSVPGRVAAGDVGGAVGAALVGIGTVAVLIVLWRLVLGAGLRVRGEGPARVSAAGRLGLLGRLPYTPTGAIAARSLMYWFRDARMSRQLILIPVLPTLMLVSSRLSHLDGVAIAIGPIVASLLPLSAFAGLSYDGTAFAAELAAGVRGLHDRVGRAVALLAIALPATVLVQVVVALIIGRPGDLPAMFGLSLATLLVSIGVVSVSSARLVVPVARAGRNPFSAQPGSATVSLAGSYAVSGVTSALILPVVVLAILALVLRIGLLGWLALALGLILGAAVAVGGVVLGGRMLDRSGPDLLARLRLIRN